MTYATITLQPREPPLTAVAVAATGAAVAGLAAAACRRLAAGADLRAAASPAPPRVRAEGAGSPPAAAADRWLVVLADGDDLPWADGCVYLGRDGALLLPTTRAVAPSADLVASALRGEHGRDAALVVLLDDAVLLGPLPARPADRARLAQLR